MVRVWRLGSDLMIKTSWNPPGCSLKVDERTSRIAVYWLPKKKRWKTIITKQQNALLVRWHVTYAGTLPFFHHHNVTVINPTKPQIVTLPHCNAPCAHLCLKNKNSVNNTLNQTVSGFGNECTCLPDQDHYKKTQWCFPSTGAGGINIKCWGIR